MKYEEHEFEILKKTVQNYTEKYLGICKLTEEWKSRCRGMYEEDMLCELDFLRYSHARRMLARKLQDNLIYMEETERYPVCELVLLLIAYGCPDDGEVRTAVMNQAWYINRQIKRFDFPYWELLLREAGEDETDVVRKIYAYLKTWENRMEAADTLYEYIMKYPMEVSEKEEMFAMIAELEQDSFEE